MNDLDIVQIAVIQLAQIVKDITCMVGDPDGLLTKRLEDCYERAEQIKLELERL
jgi:hypothetical protein